MGNKLRGIGLLELMLSLSIIALLIVLVFKYYPIVNTSRRVNSALQMVQVLQTATDRYRDLYRDPALRQQISVQKLLENGLIPKDFALQNPWGGEIQLTTATNSTAQLQYTRVSEGECLQLVDAITQLGLKANTQQCAAQIFQVTF